MRKARWLADCHGNHRKVNHAQSKFQEAANSLTAKVELHNHLLNVGEVFIASSANLLTQLLDLTVKGRRW
jgi:hypothetical protein